MDEGSRHERAGELFLAACDLPGDERLAWLEERCAGDADLLDAVLDLLRHDATPAGDDPLDRVLTDEMIAVLAETRAPATIGPYRIVGRLGSGGMGTVYEAVQERPKRTVALKVLQPALMTPAMLRRFEWEAEILARLDHPGIAKVFEAGTADTGHGPQPYFAMELVRGVPITRHASRASLDPRARLALVADVCSAVHHAHQKGIVHRDVKPANGLVGVAGRPKLLDCGVARATDSDLRATTIETRAGELIGTLPHMSPEQVGGDPTAIDTRS
ncbi:MAG: serine/threonine-protein kinase, partial [Planctomycetota bacterium]